MILVPCPDNLTVRYRTQGHYAVAEPLYKRSLAIREQALGPDHPVVATLKENGVQTHVLCCDTPDQEIGRVHIQVLHPLCHQSGLDTNKASLVLRLSHGEVDFLFSGNVETAGEHVLLSTQVNLESGILKVPHHGSRSSSTLAFIKAASPKVAIASLGHQNRFRFLPQKLWRGTSSKR